MQKRLCKNCDWRRQEKCQKINPPLPVRRKDTCKFKTDQFKPRKFRRGT